MKLFQNMILVVIGCLVGVLLLEGVLRIVGYSRPVFGMYDFNIGATSRPNTEGWYDGEDIIYIKINEDGIRGPKCVKEKPPGVFRIAILGDSFTASSQVKFEERFSFILQQELNKCRSISKEVEVINFGVDGFGTARAIQMFRHKAVSYQPDLVLLVFCDSNDVRNNHPTLDRNPFLPYFVFHDGQLVLDDSFRRNPEFLHKLKWSNLRNELVKRSRVLQVINKFYEKVIHPLRKQEAPLPVAGYATDKKVIVPASLAPPTDLVWQEAWLLSEAMIAQLRDDVVGSGAEFWLTVTATGEQVDPDPEKRQAAMEFYGIPTLDYTADRLQAFAEGEGIPFIRLNERMREEAERANTNFHYFERKDSTGGHWNRHGHRVVGQIMAERLCKN